MTFIEEIKERAKKTIKTIILPEAEDIRVLQATEKVIAEKYAKIILIGNKKDTQEKAKANGINIEGAEIIEPENIKGVKIVKNKNEVKVENTKLDIVKIYQNYEYMIDNCIDLNAFIEKYKKSDTQKYKENENEIILEIENENNKYEKYIALYVKKNTGKPVKMEIKDNSKKTLIYILYREVKLK